MESLLYDYHLAKSMGDNLPYSENYKKASVSRCRFQEVRYNGSCIRLVYGMVHTQHRGIIENL